MIREALQKIKQHTGIEFETCDFFTRKLSEKEKLKCIDVILKDPMWLSSEYDKLENFAKKYKTISVYPAGYKRVRININ